MKHGAIHFIEELWNPSQPAYLPETTVESLNAQEMKLTTAPGPEAQEYRTKKPFLNNLPIHNVISPHQKHRPSISSIAHQI
ncbi:hypothetical protein PGT21_021030 [Puccinia graminis f. sp. tritici]|uniref:Uncharacterized protein n=1 Tax=Puccinia graminis f. sp. tritici TaxID=56615 RepID=A0A5B0LUW3_PUCGR|nr:hypothetical protein PGT21_021030 [Puccinia graminis f. sp. tritici]KAA1091756.1 hypothetical protein PGTUg99_010949 [Puccinia graminis f. sp. tritici]